MNALNELAEMIASTPEDKLQEMNASYEMIFENMNHNNQMINEIKDEFYRQHSTEDDLFRLKAQVENHITTLQDEYKDSQVKVELLEKMKVANVKIIDTIIMEGLEPIIPIQVTLIHANAKMPEYAHEGDAGMDLYVVEDKTIQPNETTIIPTGLKMIIPQGYEVVVRPRSGMSVKTKIRIANAPGTIDSNYRGEVGVIIDNIGTEPYEIKQGDRIAQIVMQKVPKMSFQLVETKTIEENSTERNENGYGSSGK